MLGLFIAVYLLRFDTVRILLLSGSTIRVKAMFFYIYGKLRAR